MLEGDESEGLDDSAAASDGAPLPKEILSPALSPQVREFLEAAALDIESYQAARGHIPRKIAPSALLRLLTDARLAAVIKEVDFDRNAAMTDQTGRGARDAGQQELYNRGQVAAAIALNGGQVLTPDQEMIFVAQESPLYELLASGVVEPYPSGEGIIIHIQRDIDLCLDTAA
ncbi:hypothetical protein HY604_04660 [Candidatus Peregrinibacteria bacterium]|nr:hypothetical protein [Candidatus Peregrinibacteria bacterium]